MSETDEGWPPSIASASDIDLEAAYVAYRNVSMDPEGRAARDAQAYEEDIAWTYGELWPAAESDEQKEVLALEMVRYRDGYRKRLAAIHAASAKAASPMVVGPAGFPVATNRKQMDAVTRRMEDLVRWKQHAIASIGRKLRVLRPAESTRAAEWARHEAAILEMLGYIGRHDDGETAMRGMDRGLLTSSIASRVRRLVDAGETEWASRATAIVREWQDGRRKPVFTPRHSFWRLVDGYGGGTKTAEV